MKIFIYLTALFLCTSVFAQDNFWVNKTKTNISQDDIINYTSQVSKYSVFELNEAQLVIALQDAPGRFEANSSQVLIQFPYTQNKSGVFEMFQVQTLAPQLATNYPSIKSYVGKHRGSNADRIRLTVTPHGIYAKIFSPDGSIYINPLTKSAPLYKVFYHQDAIFSKINCDFENQIENQATSASSDVVENVVDDSTFRIYRLAAAANGEYSIFHINQAGVSNGTTAQKKSAVLAAMTVSLDRVNGILENDLSVNLQFIPNTDNFIFLDPATDPYTNPNSTVAILNDNNNFMPGAVGDANYDIGHVYTTAPGGVAFVGAICNDNIKAGGVSGSSSPVGDGFDLILTHEFGHQLGASHSYNNFCNGNRSDNSVYEAGSGVTVMSYAGICSPNTQNNRFDHYHPGSILQMFNFISNTSCAQTSAISNSPPNITPNTDYTIPKRTPFILDVLATDSDGDDLTYNWEQFDNELGPQPPVSSSTSGPLFRGFKPTTTSLRYFPRLETILNNQLQTVWEVLPNVERSMDFVVTVRDNNILGGQNTLDLTVLNVENAGPFEVTSQNSTGITWLAGTTETVTWNVAGTTANGINASEVDILLSTNGGISFDTVLSQNTPNDGSQNITVPFDAVGQDSRLMVKASDNIFFSVNEEEFNVNATCENANNTSTVSIPDGAGFLGPVPGTPAESIINISQNDIVQSVALNLDLSHDRMIDIDIELESPDGQIVQLWNRDLCNAEGLDLRFLDGGITLPSGNCDDTITGFFEPVESLSAFVGGSTNGDWTLRVTDFFLGNTGSINSWSIEVCSATTLNTEEFSQDLFSLLPNPASSEVKIQFNQILQNIETEIYDVSGRLVKSIEKIENTQTQNLNISDLSSGIYFVKVKQDNQQVVKKLIVE